MATLWADGFEDNTAANLAYDYPGSSGGAFVTGRRAGTYAWHQSGNNIGNIRQLPSTYTTLFCSIAFQPTNLVAAGTFLRFSEGTTHHVSIAPDGTGKLTVYRGDPKIASGTLLGTSANVVFNVGQWTWFQVKVVIHDTTGSVEVRDASGNVIINLTGQDTRNGGTSGVIDRVGMGCPSGSAQLGYYDDWHIWDTAGSVCNTWTGDTRIDHILPDGAGDATQFTPSAGSNYQCVDEASVNTTDYVDSSTAGHQDLYTMGNLSHTPVNIYGLLRRAIGQKDDAGARSLKLLTKSGGTLNTGAANTLELGTWKAFSEVVETDPATSAAWTKTALNAAQVGIENV